MIVAVIFIAFKNVVYFDKFLIIINILQVRIGGEILSKLCWLVLWIDRALTEFDGFYIFNADATDETKICPFILTGKF